VQLIPIDPARATEAAELVADLLRTTLEEQRDEVTLGDEALRLPLPRDGANPVR
jgi:hypothetical protein